MTMGKRLAAGVCAALLGWGRQATASPVGQVGFYAIVHYVVSATATGGGQCTDAAQTYYTSTFYYPGPGKPGSIDWRPINLPNYLGEFVSAFPKSPAAGVSQSSGTYTITTHPAGTVTTATYSATVTTFDTHSSIETATYTYPTSSGGSCTTHEQLNYTPLGK